MKMELYNDWLCKCIVQECRNLCPEGKQVQTLPIYRDFKNTNVSVATRKSQSVAHTCAKRMEMDWKTGSYANN